MSWITVVWSMVSAVCLTLAAIHFAIWLKRRREIPHLLFALSALGAAGSGFIELTMLKATTVAGYVTAVRLSYLPLTLLLIAMAWYTCKYFGVGRPILAMVITVMWALVVIVDAFAPFGLNLKEIYALRFAQTPWGESFALPRGESSPLHHLLKVTIATEWNGDGAVRASVRDYGAARDRILDPFFTTKTEGLGMGLAIVRSIIESNGGTMAVDNPNDGGARFYFTLPVKMGSYS